MMRTAAPCHAWLHSQLMISLDIDSGQRPIYAFRLIKFLCSEYVTQVDINHLMNTANATKI